MSRSHLNVYINKQAYKAVKTADSYIVVFCMLIATPVTS